MNSNFQTSDQIYTGADNADINNFDGNVYASYSGSIKKLNYNLNLGLYINHLHNSISGNETYVFFTPTLNLSYNFTNSFSLRLSEKIDKRRPSLSDLSTAETVIDAHYISRGNPYLKTNNCYAVQLVPQYSFFAEKLLPEPIFHTDIGLTI